MRDYTIQDFIAEAEKQERFLQQQIARFDTLLADYDAKTSDLRARKSQAVMAITRRLLPEFSNDGAARLARTLGNTAVAGLHAEYLREKEQLGKRIAAIEADGKFQKRDYLLAPGTGVISSQIAEVEPMYEEASSYCAALENKRRFSELAARRYGTPDYPHRGLLRFFNTEFLQDWRNADVIEEAMQGKPFAEILEQYDDAKNRRMVFGQTIAELRAQQAEIEGLAAEHDEKQRLLTTTDERYMLRAASFTGEWLRGAPPAEITAMLSAAGAETDEAQRADGLEHQIDYIRGLAEKVTADRNALVEKSAAITQEAMRYKADPHRFRNKRWEQGSFSRKFTRDAGRYDKLYGKYERTGETIYVFNDYGRGSMLGDFLWWDVMTDGRLDGNFIPEVNEYYASHPDYSYASPGFSSYDNS